MNSMDFEGLTIYLNGNEITDTIISTCIKHNLIDLEELRPYPKLNAYYVLEDQINQINELFKHGERFGSIAEEASLNVNLSAQSVFTCS